jgi:hypothetical protein
MWSVSLALLLGVAAADTPAPRSELAPPVRLLADGKPINVDIGHAAPFMADVLAEGKPQLLVGQFGDGKLRIYRNAGTAKEPRFAAFEWFKAGADVGKIPSG